MAQYIAKSLVSKPLDAVKSATKDVGSKPMVDEDMEAQMLVAEEKRRERFENMEEERESLRQTIRDKYGIKKKEFLDVNDADQCRRASTPRPSDVGLAQMKRPVTSDDTTSINLPPIVREVATKVVEVPQKLLSEANEKCCLM